MTNKDIITKVITNDKSRLTEEECDFIFANYRKAEVHESNDWYTVIREGNDVKYGRFNEELTNSAIHYYDEHHHNLHPCFI